MDKFPTLTTPRLRLRPWREEDRAPFAALNADPAVMAHFPAPLTRAESDAAVDRLNTHMAEHGFAFWATEERDGGAFVGAVGLLVPKFQAHFTPCVEIGWRLAKEFWGRGYATEAAQAAMDFGFGELNLPEIVSFTVPANRPSWTVMQRLGMTRNPAEDFDHPGLPEGHPLRRHVLYRRQRP